MYFNHLKIEPECHSGPFPSNLSPVYSRATLKLIEAVVVGLIRLKTF